MADQQYGRGDDIDPSGTQQRPEQPDAPGKAHWTKGGAWVGGVILIALGVIFLLKNFGFPVPDNWWAIFLMIPGIAALGGAVSIYEREHAWTRAAMGSLVSGLILTGMSLVFFFGFDFGRFWPVILILIGIAALSGASLPRGRSGRRQ